MYRAALVVTIVLGMVPALIFMVRFRYVNLIRWGSQLPISIYLFGHTLAIFLLYLRSILTVWTAELEVDGVSLGLAILIDIMQWTLVLALYLERRGERSTTKEIV